MNSSLFIAKKIIKASKTTKRNSQTIIRIASIGTVLSTIIMILTIFISYGFKNNILKKVRHFSSDIQVINYDANRSYDLAPVQLQESQKNKIIQIPNVSSISGFITKPAILKFKNNIEGVILKSYEKDGNYSYIRESITEGIFPDFAQKEILISEEISKKLHLHVGDPILLYFIQNPIRYRKLKVSGIYKTDIYEFDHLFAFVDINILQKINTWDKDLMSGFEINLKEPLALEETQQQIESVIRPAYFNSEHSNQLLKSLSIKERFAEFYFWFNLFDTNVIVIISLMITVAVINLISALLIVIIENMNMIGLLKSFGYENKSIRKVFMYFSVYLVLKGVFWGNIIALIIAYLQFEFHILPLDAKNYYISYVPIDFDWQGLFILNSFAILLIISLLLIPVNYISRVSPIKVIRFN